MRFHCAKARSYEEVKFFRAYTTTLIRLYLERQVSPPDHAVPCALLTWDPIVEV